MKTITMDYDIYKGEILRAQESGHTLTKVLVEKSYALLKATNGYSRETLLEAEHDMRLILKRFKEVEEWTSK